MSTRLQPKRRARGERIRSISASSRRRQERPYQDDDADRERYTTNGAETADDRSLDQELTHDTPWRCTDTLSDPDLAGPLGHAYEHDIHDTNAADEQGDERDRQQCEAESGGDSVGRSKQPVRFSTSYLAPLRCRALSTAPSSCVTTDTVLGLEACACTTPSSTPCPLYIASRGTERGPTRAAARMYQRSIRVRGLHR